MMIMLTSRRLLTLSATLLLLALISSLLLLLLCSQNGSSFKLLLRRGDHEKNDDQVGIGIDIDQLGGARALATDDENNDSKKRHDQRYRNRTRVNDVPPLDDNVTGSNTIGDELFPPENQSAVFLIQEIEYEGHAFLGINTGTVDEDEETIIPQYHRSRTANSQSRRRERTENIQLPDGTIYQVKNARDGWASRLKSGRYSVRIPRDSIIHSNNGTIDMRNEELIATAIRDEKKARQRPNERDNDATTSQRQLQGSVGIRTVLVVRVILDDGAYDAADPTGLSNDVFGNGVDPNNLKSQYAACSANQLQFEKSPNRIMTFNPNDGGTTDINNGVVDIKVPLRKSYGDSAIRNAVTTKINAVFGVGSPVELANHVMYCLPAGSVSGIAYAYINSWNSVFNNEWCNFVSAQMHEIGHNLGFAHSNELGTYKDQTDLMGYSYGADDVPRMCFNGAKSWQSQWYTSKSIVVDPSADVGSCFDGNLYGIADYSNPASTIVLIKIDDYSSTDIYVAFNRKVDINADTGEAGDEVTVVRAGGEGSSHSESELLAKLASGGVWSSIIDGKTMTVTVLSINTSASPAYATVRISENGNACLLAPDNPTTRIVTTEIPTSSPSGSPTTSSPTTASTVITGSPISVSPTSSPSTSPTSLPPISAPPTSKPVRECRNRRSRLCYHHRIRSKFKRLPK